jgi:hypothetical protein
MRLPTCDAWERACGAGATTLFRWVTTTPADFYPGEASAAVATTLYLEAASVRNAEEIRDRPEFGNEGLMPALALMAYSWTDRASWSPEGLAQPSYWAEAGGDDARLIRS